MPPELGPHKLKCRHFNDGVLLRKNMVVLLINVNDILIMGNNQALIESFIEKLKSEFSLKDLRELSYFLSINIQRIDEGFYMSHAKYISKLLEKQDLANSKPCNKLVSSSSSLSKYDEDPPSKINDAQYRFVIVTLHYYILNQPDISYTIHKLSQFLHYPTTAHFLTRKRLLQYLKGTMPFHVMLYNT